MQCSLSRPYSASYLWRGRPRSRVMEDPMVGESKRPHLKSINQNHCYGLQSTSTRQAPSCCLTPGLMPTKRQSTKGLGRENMLKLLNVTIIFSAVFAFGLPAFAKSSDTKTGINNTTKKIASNVKRPSKTKTAVPPSGPVPIPYPNQARSNVSTRSPSRVVKYRPRPGYPPLAK